MTPVIPVRPPFSGSAPGLPAEPPVYRPFALLAFGSTLLLGTPIGLWALAWLYLHGPAVPAPWLMLHAHVQVFGFFATLIPGVALHLVPRFTGRPVTRPRLAPWLAAALALALVLRLAGTAIEAAAALAAAALVQAAGFAGFALWVWRSLDPPPLRLVRGHLTLASLWLAAACGLEAAPAPVARMVPVALAAASFLAAAGEMGAGEGGTATVVARLGEALGLATIAVVAASAGFRLRAPAGLPMLARSPEETRMFRLAVLAAAAALVATLAAAGVAVAGGQAHVVTDAARHLFTVGFLTSVAVAMTFRLIPVLERAALPWPCLRGVAFHALVGALVARTAEVIVAHGWPALAPVVPASGVLVWVALAAVAANLGGAIIRRRRRVPPEPGQATWTLTGSGRDGHTVARMADGGRAPVLTRLLAWVVLALMAVATLYTGWIAVANFHRIGV
jgi:hypothetical protein